MGAIRCRLLVLLSAVAAGCSGVIGDPPMRGVAGSNPGASPPGMSPSAPPSSTGGGGSMMMMSGPPPSSLPAPSPCLDNRPGPRVLRRLTAQEFNDTVMDLFRDPSVPSATFFNDPPVLGFTSDAGSLVVQDLTAEQIMDFAESVATWADGHLGGLTPCMTMDVACRHQFIQTFGTRTFRAPLADDRVLAYDALFASAASFADGAHAVIQAMLQSPHFLYRLELGVPDPNKSGFFNLTPYEIASSLSYLLTGSMPDDQLFSAAASGQLSTRAQIDAQARRLLTGPRGQDAIMRFMTQWLGLDRILTAVKDTNAFNLTDALRQSMFGETKQLIVDTVFNQDGTFADVLTADHTFVDENLAQFYGLGIHPGASFQKYTYPTGARDPGFLAHAGILTAYALASSSSPVQRGKLVRTRLLCQHLNPPPPGVNPVLPPPSAPQTTRQRYEGHDSNPFCATCHKLMDPIGFGFEHYDAFGRRRDVDNGMPVDSSGMIYQFMGGDVAFDGISALAADLAKDPDVDTCMLRFWSYSAYGMSSWDQDACTYDAAGAEASASGFKLMETAMSLLHVPHFTTRVQDP
jgi:hypothetical protein